MKRKLIIDVDTGIDDALALAYVLGNNDADLIGVTTSFGNTTMQQATVNTLTVLETLKRGDIPVYRGAECPEGKPSWLVSEHLKVIHGHDGLGNLNWPAPSAKPKDKPAREFIAEQCERFGSDLTVITLGPLTNLANTWQKYPDSLKKCGRIFIMGGALTVRGNVTPYAEANIYNDPAAAQTIFSSGLDLSVIGLDVTLKTAINGEDIEFLTRTNSVAADLLYRISEYYYTNETGVIGGALHDPLAVASAIDESLVTSWHYCNLEVWQSEEGRGRLTGNQKLLGIKEKHVRYALDIDEKRFLECFRSSLRKVI